jgi:hypothetical protein
MNSRLVYNSLKNATKSSNSLVQTALKSSFKPSLANAILRTESVSVRTFSSSISQMNAQSNGLKDLTSFLNKEIELEKEARKHKGQLPKVSGFDVKTDGPNVTLTKSHEGEEIVVKLNVNGSLNNNLDQNVENEKPEGQSEPEMKARPLFTVEIKRNNQVLSFACDFLPSEEAGESSETPGNYFSYSENLSKINYCN